MDAAHPPVDPMLGVCRYCRKKWSRWIAETRTKYDGHVRCAVGPLFRGLLLAIYADPMIGLRDIADRIGVPTSAVRTWIEMAKGETGMV